MKYQHHDVAWIEVTDLRRKGIETFDKSVQQCHEIMLEASDKIVEKKSNTIAVFNVLPRRRRSLICLDGNNPQGTGVLQQKYGDKIFGIVDLPAGGYKGVESGGHTLAESRPIVFNSHIMADHYEAHLSVHGLIERLSMKNGRSLLESGDYLGGEIRALVNDEWIANREASCLAFDGPVAQIVERQTALGKIPLRETYYYFKHEPLIKVELNFEFSGDEVGYFWLDETKINVYYPTSGSGLFHDIPFGYVSGRENRTLFATNWVYANGLVYINRGTPKHWMRKGVLANVLAWGSRSFTNRLQFGWADKNEYDLLLYGKQRLEYYLMPVGEFHGNRICQAVQDYLLPVFLTQGAGQRSFYETTYPDLWISSVHETDGKVYMRGFQLPLSGKGSLRDWEIFDLPLEEICTLG